ncbi:MAG: glutathione S-transferase family protein [Pseudomonadota bacterium]|jgi:glutathione S-transferase|nr:glutathione S-transferase family protein [Pseudomonadota bacterium]
MTKRILWGVGSSRALRAHWALVFLGLEYETRAILTRTPAMETPEYRAVNPRGKIPTLIDGDLTVTESPAIVAYLAERYSTPERRLIPEGIEQRAFYFEWMSFISMELDATSLYVLRRHEGLPEIYGPAPEACVAARAYFERMIKAAALRLDDGRRFLLGEAFFGVDILMTSCLDLAVNYGFELPEAFAAYRARIDDEPSTILAHRANAPS